MLSVAKFLQSFPEFNMTNKSLVRAKIAAAEAQTSSTWGSNREQGVMYLAAHLLSMSPDGELARLSTKDKTDTMYSIEYNRLKKASMACVSRVL